jgi:predicted NAD-dependent protein-ADP-ribosyltransferase YbiA (DUF1768 family)
MVKPVLANGVWYDTFDTLYVAAFEVDGVRYNSAEQYFQVRKTRDPEMREHMLAESNPRHVWYLGTGRRDNTLAEGDKDIMYRGTYAKFTQNPRLSRELLETEDAQLCILHSRTQMDRMNEEVLTDVRSAIRELASHAT